MLGSRGEGVTVWAALDTGSFSVFSSLLVFLLDKKTKKQNKKNLPAKMVVKMHNFG